MSNYFIKEDYGLDFLNGIKNMSREIKFRVWDNIGKEMIDETSKKYFKIYLNSTLSIESEWLSTDEYELLQYTGFKDGEGSEIFEGDILKEQHHPDSSPEIYKIYFDEKDGQWMANNEKRRYWNSLSSLLKYVEAIKIIGNIYEGERPEPEGLQKKVMDFIKTYTEKDDGNSSKE